MSLYQRVMFALLLPALASAEQLTLKQLLDGVITYHPLIEAALQEREGARGALLSAQGAFDPSLKGGGKSFLTGYYDGSYLDTYIEQPTKLYGTRLVAGYRKSAGAFPTYEDEFYTNSGGEYRAGVEVPILRDGPIDARRANIDKASIQTAIAENNIELRMIDLVRAATVAFWESVAAAGRLKIYEDLLVVAEVRNQQLAERVNKGDLPRFDLIDNERAIFQRQSQKVAADRSLRQSLIDLSLFYRTGRDQPQLIGGDKLPKVLPNPRAAIYSDESRWVEQAFAKRPEIRRLNSQREQNQIDLNLAQNQIKPRLDLGMEASQDTGGNFTSREEGEIKAQVKFEIPLQTRTQQGRIDAARAKEVEIERTLSFLKERIAAEVKNAIVQIRLSEERLGITRKELKTAREVEEGERSRFVMGDSNLVFVNLREQTTAEAAVREIDALLEYHKALASLNAAVGLSPEEVKSELN